MEKGLVSRLATSKIAEFADEKIVLKGWAETIDGTVIDQGLNFVDNTFGEKVPEPYKTNIRDMIDHIVLDEDLASAEEHLTDLMVIAINVPWLDEENEKRLFSSLLNFIVSLLIFILDKKKKAAQPTQ